MKSLQITRKSIEDANKPFIACYIDLVEVGHLQKYLIIKNFGRTPAMILDIQFDRVIEGLGREGEINSLKGSLIAPNQKVITVMNLQEKRIISVEVTYKDMQNNVMTHTYELNSGFSRDMRYANQNKSKLSDDTNVLRNLLHQYAKRNL